MLEKASVCGFKRRCSALSWPNSISLEPLRFLQKDITYPKVDYQYCLIPALVGIDGVNHDLAMASTIDIKASWRVIASRALTSDDNLCCKHPTNYLISSSRLSIHEVVGISIQLSRQLGLI
jgi:hypothetical protein